jgi:hypothetical protein
VKNEEGQADDTFSIGVEDFIITLADGSLEPKAAGRSIVVRGSVDLRDHPLGRVIKEIPEVTITGDLIADRTCELRTCRCRVSGQVTLDGSPVEEFLGQVYAGGAGTVGGMFSARECAGLRRISGKFNNDVDLAESGIVVVGEDFCCSGELGLQGCLRLREVDCVAWSINADGSSLTQVGPNTVVENLSVVNCSSLTVAAPVTGLTWAKYDGSGIREVPPSFRCDGPVYLNGCKKLRSLSGHMLTVEVSGARLDWVADLETSEIIFSNCAKLPENMTRIKAKAICFDHCGIEKFPGGIPEGASVRVGGCRHFSQLPVVWKGGISLTNLPSFTETPRGFRCDKNFDVEDCPSMTRLGGRIGGDLWILSGVGGLRELGEDLQVDGDLTMSGLSEVQRLNCRVGKDVVAGRSQVRETREKFSVGGDADLHGCKKLSVVRGRVGGMAMFDESAVQTIGADFECGGDLCVRGTESLVSLNCSVGGRVLAGNSSLRRTGPAFWCAGNLNITGCERFETVQGVVGGRTRRGGRVVEREGGESSGKGVGLKKAGGCYPTESVAPRRKRRGGK